MALIKEVRGFTPKFGNNVFLAENATIIGDVEMGDDCSIWYNAVLRGDVNSIRLGNKVNIQDGTVLHTLYQKSVVEIGNRSEEHTSELQSRPHLVCRLLLEKKKKKQKRKHQE